VLAATVVACGGDDDPAVCGAGDAPADGVTASGGGVEIRYAAFTAGPNNDCPVADAPTSLTIVGIQVGTEAPLTLCIPRPDRWADAPADLRDEVQIENVSGVLGECSIRLDRTVDASGTVTATGLCFDGVEPSAFALDIAGEVGVTRTCGTTTDSLRLTLAGRVAVAPLPLPTSP
jgi:hypothetical protein